MKSSLAEKIPGNETVRYAGMCCVISEGNSEYCMKYFCSSLFLLTLTLIYLVPIAMWIVKFRTFFLIA